MGETTIERKKKRGEPFNPFASDANSQRNQRHNKRAQSSPQRTPRPTNQPVKNNTLTDLDKKRKEALERMSESEPNAAGQGVAKPTTTGISKQNQKQQTTEKTSSRADRLAELRKKSAASKLNAEQQKVGAVVEEIAPVVEVVQEVKLVEAKAEIESFSAVAKASVKPAVSQLNVFKVVEETQIKATNDRRKKRRPHAKKGGGRQKQEKRLNRQKYLEYKYAARDILDNPTVPEEHRSNILGQVWAKGERMSVDESYEFIDTKILENILTEEIGDKLKSLVRKYTTRR